MKVPLRWFPQAAGAPHKNQWAVLELLLKAMVATCSSGPFHHRKCLSRHSRAGVSPSVLLDDSPARRCTESAALIVYPRCILGKESEMTGDKEGTESQESTRKGWIRKQTIMHHIVEIGKYIKYEKR